MVQVIHRDLSPPTWWHRNGAKTDWYRNRDLTIHSRGDKDVAKLKVSPAGKGLWSISWVIKYNQREEVHGRVRVSTSVVRAAFGLSDETSDYSKWMLENYSADAAEQGAFIRKGPYLNIPCPGIGRDGDPNISLLLSEEARHIADEILR